MGDRRASKKKLQVCEGHSYLSKAPKEFHFTNTLFSNSFFHPSSHSWSVPMMNITDVSQLFKWDNWQILFAAVYMHSHTTDKFKWQKPKTLSAPHDEWEITTFPLKTPPVSALFVTAGLFVWTCENVCGQKWHENLFPSPHVYRFWLWSKTDIRINLKWRGDSTVLI